jgi:hypothetical protein
MRTASNRSGLSLDSHGRLKLSEAQVQTACVQFLEAEGYRVFETHSRRAFASAGRKGQPDLVAVRFDSTLLVEVKALGKKPKPHQVAYGRAAIEDGLRYIVVDDVARLRAEVGR